MAPKSENVLHFLGSLVQADVLLGWHPSNTSHSGPKTQRPTDWQAPEMIGRSYNVAVALAKSFEERELKRLESASPKIEGYEDVDTVTNCYGGYTKVTLLPGPALRLSLNGMCDDLDADNAERLGKALLEGVSKLRARNA